MTEFEYHCPDCGRELGVDGPGREAIMQNGCPLCATSVRVDSFTAQRR